MTPMKALILAAGLGTRLRPFTENTPKPLFTVSGISLLDTLIHNLQRAGCNAIMINTHHLHGKIDAHLAGKAYGLPVTTRHEPEILGTGGAIKNVADFWDDRPFMVINSDIFTDIDFRKVYDFHLNHPHPATLVLHDDPEFNTVTVDGNGFIEAFDEGPRRNTRPPLPDEKSQKLTFTGIQVLNPEILNLIPDNAYYSIIDVYRTLTEKKRKISAFFSKKYLWRDLGTPERYRQAVFDNMAPEAFKQAFGEPPSQRINRKKLKGDGSDRAWYRLHHGVRSLVMADHGIKKDDRTSEAEAFVAIGRHLFNQGLPVPEIYLYDTFSGLVFMEDLGDVHLQKVILKAKNPDRIIPHYQSIIRLLGRLSLSGSRGFDPGWTCQTVRYDKNLILEKECRYFVDAFLGEYLGMDICFADLEDEFRHLADKSLEFSVDGFMHRDMQSRNIILNNDHCYLIDFQGGRLGPIQYDLASLLIDPYVAFPPSVRDTLLDFSVKILAPAIRVHPHHFLSCYKYCAITRNLQILGAFGYLTRIKKKTYFEKYIPNAIKTLEDNLSAFKDTEFPVLKSIVKDIGSMTSF
jgi:NDP-sugar pyrophosphorylase family protein/aminoglycoside/choline kinase family phosphotransferase